MSIVFEGNILFFHLFFPPVNRILFKNLVVSLVFTDDDDDDDDDFLVACNAIQLFLKKMISFCMMITFLSHTLISLPLIVFTHFV